MFGVQEILGIIGGIVAIVRILFATIGVYRVRGKQKWCIPMGFGLFFAGFLAFITSFPQWAMGVSILATLSLVVVAFLAIEVANAREQRHRKDELSKEERYRDERLLNEIIEWAIDIAKCESELQMTTLPVAELVAFEQLAKDQVIKYINSFDRANLMRRYQTVDARSEYIKTIAIELDKEFKGNLHPVVRRTANKLAKNIIIIRKCLEGQVTEEEYNKHWHSLIESAIPLTRKTAKIKTRDIGRKEENMSKEGEATGSNEPTLKNIEEHLTRIEGHIIQSNKKTKAQALGGIGFTSMAVGMSLVVTRIQTTGGLVIFGLGLILMLYSYYFM